MTVSSEGWFGLKEITIIPVGEVDREVLTNLANELEAEFNLKTELGSEMHIPKDSFNPRRNQYYASRILKLLKAEHPFHEGPIIGVCDVDLFIPDHDFVFGESDPISQISIISLTRFKEGFIDKKQDKTRFIKRVLRVAVHELGHIYGLGHCMEEDCVMHFSNDKAAKNRIGHHLCERCKAKIKSRI